MEYQVRTIILTGFFRFFVNVFRERKKKEKEKEKEEEKKKEKEEGSVEFIECLTRL